MVRLSHTEPALLTDNVESAETRAASTLEKDRAVRNSGRGGRGLTLCQTNQSERLVDLGRHAESRPSNPRSPDTSHNWRHDVADGCCGEADVELDL